MKFIAIISAAAALKTAHKSTHVSKMEMIQAHADVKTEQSDRECIDWDDAAETDIGGDGCAWYEDHADQCGAWDDEDFSANAYCCACGGSMPDWYYDAYYM